MVISDISGLKEKCTGCMVCVDICPMKSISSYVADDGFKYTTVDRSSCVNCGKCYAVCPIENKSVQKHKQHLYVAVACDKTCRNAGSSGGVFGVVANRCLKDGYYVCGAAFNNLALKHKIINDNDEIGPLLKSKYIQSDTEEVYQKILNLLIDGQKVLFCGTPCQVSALVNCVPVRYSKNLIAIDFVCHGVPSQKTFDMYIGSLEKKHNGKIVNFSFRVKDNEFNHAHGFSYVINKDEELQKIDGIYTQSSYYNAFKKYLFFRNSCYNCKYATLERVSDITLADFWGVEKYDSRYDTDRGVSMVIINSPKGFDLMDSVYSEIECKELPLRYGVESNFCLTHATEKPAKRDEIIDSLNKLGYEETAEKYFKSGWINKIYWIIPNCFRKIIRKIRR